MRFWTALLLVATLALAACEPKPLGHPPLWRIADADSEIWLFGTVHVLPGDLAWRSPQIEAAFAASDELVTEADVSDDAATAALAAQYGLAPEGARLSEQLEPARRVQLARVIATLNANSTEIERMRPWLASLRLSYLYALSRGQQRSAGVEAVLVPEAQARGMQLSYLETPEQQIRTLADLPDADQLNLLRSTLDEIEQSEDIMETTQRAWAAGDVRRLTHLLETQMRAAGEAPYEALITRRNQAWSEAIQNRLQGSGRTFYAVGAAHLLGDDSVIAKLREEGLAVEGP
ncbi:MAG: TraB/GumN family protein [Hyphomonadaceae bacterium]|nr:TraB/GumN family protein [Hyphomonadaceae bacterium]